LAESLLLTAVRAAFAGELLPLAEASVEPPTASTASAASAAPSFVNRERMSFLLRVWLMDLLRRR
jgi:hypothetical protein